MKTFLPKKGKLGKSVVEAGKPYEETRPWAPVDPMSKMPGREKSPVFLSATELFKGVRA